MGRIAPFLAAIILLEGACTHSAHYYFDKGDKLYAKGSYADAALNYRIATQKDPAFGPAFYQLGLSELRLGKPPEAYTALSRAADLLPNRKDVTVTLADLSLKAYLADRRRPAALYNKVDALADQVLARDAKSYDGLRLKAHLAVTDRKLDYAEELYRRANEVKRWQPEVIMAWTEVMLADGNAKQGEDLALQFIQKNKTYVPIYNLLFRYYLRLNQFDDGERILKTRGANNPTDPNAVLELAAFYASRSREADMQAAVQHLLDDPRTFPQGHLQAGDLYLRLQRWDQALEQYNAGSRPDAKDRVIYLKRIADVWLAQGKGEQADHAVDEILAEAPGDESAKGVRASLLLAKPSPENIGKAVALFQGLVDKSPENAVWRFNLGRALAANGDSDRARVQLQEAVKLRHDFVPPRVILAELSQTKGDYRSTLQYTNEILALDPRMTRMRLLNAVSLMNTGDQGRGRAQLRGLEKEFPQDPDIQLELGAVDLNDGRLPEAEKRFRKLLADRRDDVPATSGLVRTLLAEKLPDAALSFLQHEVETLPTSVQLRSLLASTEVQTGKYSLALAEYEHLAAQAPNSPQAHLAVGEAYLRLGDFANAISYFQKAESLAPNDPVPLSREGESLALSGQKRQALEKYRRALQLKPDDAELTNATAYLIADVGGSLDEALKLARKAVTSNPQRPDFSDTLGWIYFKKDLNDSALQLFRILTTKNPDNATFRYHFGMALLKKGDKNMAESELKAALSKNPSGEVRNEIETALRTIG
jgi:tetratricopeptide (TPR) repeat protein